MTKFISFQKQRRQINRWVCAFIHDEHSCSIGLNSPFGYNAWTCTSVCLCVSVGLIFVTIQGSFGRFKFKRDNFACACIMYSAAVCCYR